MHLRGVPVAKCRYCGADTILYVNGAPVCVNCSNLIDAGKKPPVREELPEDEQKQRAE